MDSTVNWKSSSHTLDDPTEQDFQEWLQELPSSIAVEMSAHGFERCKDLLALRLHTAERNSAYQEYLKSEV